MAILVSIFEKIMILHFEITEGEAAKISPSFGAGRVAGTESKTVKLMIHVFKRQVEKKERSGGLKHLVIQE